MTKCSQKKWRRWFPLSEWFADVRVKPATDSSTNPTRINNPADQKSSRNRKNNRRSQVWKEQDFQHPKRSGNSGLLTKLLKITDVNTTNWQKMNTGKNRRRGGFDRPVSKIASSDGLMTWQENRDCIKPEGSVFLVCNWWGFDQWRPPRIADEWMRLKAEWDFFLLDFWRLPKSTGQFVV